MRKPRKIELTCKNCLKQFSVNWNKRNQTCCSRSCAILYRGGWKNHDKIDWSVVNKRAYQTGKNFVSGGTTKWIEVNCSDRTVKVQGSYEVKTCQILDKEKQLGLIKNWDYAVDRIQYVGKDGKMHTYIIDFTVLHLDNSKTYIEVKGRVTDNDLLKWEAVKKIGILEIWTKPILEEKIRA